MDKETFLKKMDNLFVDKEEYDKQLKRLLDSGAIDFEKFEDNFLDLYPIAAAIYQRETDWYLTGSLDDKVRRKARRDCNLYKSLI